MSNEWKDQADTSEPIDMSAMLADLEDRNDRLGELLAETHWALYAANQHNRQLEEEINMLRVQLRDMGERRR